MSESTNQKIAKLLRLAERAGTPAEAENASRMAERLMLKTGIEESVIRAQMGDNEGAPERIVTKDGPHYPKTFIKPRSGVGACVVRGMGNMRFYLASHTDGTATQRIMGFESDVDRAIQLMGSILLQADSAMAAWWKAAPERGWMTAAQAKVAKRQFLFSFGSAVEKRLREMYAEEVADSQSRNPGTELALVNKDAAVQSEYNKIAGAMRQSRGVKGSWAGAAEGSAAGQRANLGAKGLGGPRGAIGG